MVVNFRARGISRGRRKLTRTPTLIKKKNQNFNWALEGALYTKAAVKEQRKLKGHGLSFFIILLVAG
jgi:hypothetical protein